MTRVVFDRDGHPALVEGQPGPGEPVALRLASGAQVRLDPDLITPRQDDTAVADVAFSDLDLGPAETLREIEESLHVTRHVRETGRVRVHLRTRETEEDIDESGWRETADIERVPVGRIVSRPSAPRTADGVTIVPVYEEIVVVERKLLLTHELHIALRREPTRHTERVVLRHQYVDVERLPAADSAPGAA